MATNDMTRVVPTDVNRPRVLCRSEDIPLVVYTDIVQFNNMAFLGPSKDELVISGKRLDKNLKSTEVTYGDKSLCYQTTFRK